MNMMFGNLLLTYLSSLGLGTRGRDLFFMNLPSTPAACSAIISNGGFKRQGDPIQRHFFVAIHRNTEIRSGLAAINSLYAAIKDEWNLACPAEGRFYSTDVPGRFVRDPNNHVVFSVNFSYTTTQDRF